MDDAGQRDIAAVEAVNLELIRRFIVVAEELHFTRATARVHVVQSSLSASIRPLEHEVGAALFVRDSRHVTLTQAGRALLPAARRALAARAPEAARQQDDAARRTVTGSSAVTGNVCPVQRAAMSPAPSGGRTVEPVTEEDF